MAQQISSREDLKHDLFQELIRNSLEWIASHRQTFFSVAGTMVVSICVAAFIIASFRSLRKQAWERYFSGQNWIFANNPANALNIFNEVINSYGSTPAAVYALLSKGDVLYSQKQLPDAIQAYQQCLEKKPPKIILPFVLSGLSAAQEDHGDSQGAINTTKQFLNQFPDHYLSPKIYESLARNYELALNPDAAKEIYEKIITMYPATFWSEKARIRYQILAPQPFQTNPADTTGKTK